MITVVGLSHKSAPIEIRERAALSPEASAQLLQDLVRHPEIDEALVISTCNRVELVTSRRAASAQEPGRGLAELAEEILLRHAPGVQGHLYSFSGTEAVRHLFRVASSLDSLVLGEPQILGQLKQAFETGRQLGTVGGGLNRAVSHALRTAKRVRTETALGAGQVSVPSVAIDLARQIFGDLKGRRALLIGSGQMGQTAAKLLTSAGVELGVMGRNRERVSELASSLGAKALGFDALPEELASVDVIITTTSSPDFVVTHDQVQAVRKRRRGRSLFLIDLAVPRDVDPKVDRLESVFLYNVDDLSQIVAESLSSRQREAESALAIVDRETASFERALQAEQATPTIVSLRRQLSGTLDAELQRSLRSRLKHLSEADREALSVMLEAAVNKVMHQPTRHLRSLAEDPEAQTELDQCVAVLRDAFALSSEGVPSWRPGAPSLTPRADESATSSGGAAKTEAAPQATGGGPAEAASANPGASRPTPPQPRMHAGTTPTSPNPTRTEH